VNVTPHASRHERAKEGFARVALVTEQSQPSRRSAVIATLAGSSANTAIVSLQAIVLIPLYLHSVGPKLYGAWLASGDTLAWLQALDLGLPNLMIQRLGAAHARGDRAAVGQYFITGLLVLATIASALAGAAYLIAPVLPELFGVDGREAALLVACFRVAVLTVALSIVNNAVIGYSRGVQEATGLAAAMVVSSAIGFIVSLVAVLLGYGLWSIVMGLAVRIGVQLVASVVFVVKRAREGMGPHLRLNSTYLREMLRLAPATALGGLSYSLATQSESAAIAFAARPELVPVYVLTKRAAEMLRTLLDSIGYAAYGSFAHLVHSEQRARSLTVYEQLKSVRFAFAIAAACAYMAVNASLVGVWVGGSVYGGATLTILFGLQLVSVGGAYLVNTLYRATGEVSRGSIALIVEALVRIPLMLALVKTIGLAGMAIAATVTSSVAYVITDRWVYTSIAEPKQKRRKNAIVLGTRLLALAVAAIIGTLIYLPSWAFVIPFGAVVAMGALFVLAGADEGLVEPRQTVRNEARLFARRMRARALV
jgi:O-antigen/teichoic acid export membrane protein